MAMEIRRFGAALKQERRKGEIQEAKEDSQRVTAKKGSNAVQNKEFDN